TRHLRQSDLHPKFVAGYTRSCFDDHMRRTRHLPTPASEAGLGATVKAKRVLITGGAGFVGSHTADALLEAGHEVRIFDSLTSQVHEAGLFSYVPKGAEFILGDVRNRDQLRKAVRDAEVIFHFAASVGVGQSMYQIADYTAVNNLGTANRLQA